MADDFRGEIEFHAEPKRPDAFEKTHFLLGILKKIVPMYFKQDPM